MSKLRKFASIQRTVFLDEDGHERQILDAIDEDGVAWYSKKSNGETWLRLHPLPDKGEKK